MNFQFWLALRMLWARKSRLFQLSGFVSLAGLTIGVAILTVSMAVVSGFETTLQRSLADVTGHVQIIMKGPNTPSAEEMEQRIRELEPDLVGMTTYAVIEGVLAHKGNLSGVLVQGFDPVTVNNVLSLQSRVIEGQFAFPAQEGEFPAVIGVGLARKMNLKVGDVFRVVVPLRNDVDPTKFRRKVSPLKVQGILDLGKYEYNQRMILTPQAAVQKMSEIDQHRLAGVLLKFKDFNEARNISTRLSFQLGPGFIVKDWREPNENLLEAVQIEKVVIFFVILIIIFAAAFNVASSLYINVVKRYPEIGLLKALGLSQKQMMRVFSWQGIMIGALGLIMGLLFGLFLCTLFSWTEVSLGLISGEIYKIDRIDLDLRFMDVVAISLATLIISYLATLAPALRGARLSPIEGLRHE